MAGHLQRVPRGPLRPVRPHGGQAPPPPPLQPGPPLKPTGTQPRRRGAPGISLVTPPPPILRLNLLASNLVSVRPWSASWPPNPYHPTMSSQSEPSEEDVVHQSILFKLFEEHIPPLPFPPRPPPPMGGCKALCLVPVTPTTPSATATTHGLRGSDG